VSGTQKGGDIVDFWNQLAAWVVNFLNNILGPFLTNLFDWIPKTWTPGA
jgi:hypothetical protein